MAGHGSGDVRSDRRDDQGPGGPVPGKPATEKPAPGQPEAEVPAQLLRSWDAAEAQLFPLIMARPDAYERALSLVQLLLTWLRSSCADVPALLSQAARGEAILADAKAAADAAAGLRPDLITAAACAMRYRELAAAGAATRRLDAVLRARLQGAVWAVVEETGDQARAPFLPYQRVEAHVRSGRAVIISIEPDETMVRPVWRLDEATLDPATGRLVPGTEIGSYGSAAELDDALAGARLRLG